MPENVTAIIGKSYNTFDCPLWLDGVKLMLLWSAVQENAMVRLRLVEWTASWIGIAYLGAIK